MEKTILQLIELINEQENLIDNIKKMEELIVEDVYDNENYDLLDKVREKLDDEVFNEVEAFVRSETGLFMNTRNLRECDDEEICKQINEMFTYIYHEHENYKYAFECVGVQKSLQVELKKLLDYSEFLIIGRGVSKRWFNEIFEIKGKLSPKINNCIWDTFTNEKKNIEGLIFSRYLSSMEQRLKAIQNKQGELEDNLEFLQYMIFDMNKKDE